MSSAQQFARWLCDQLQDDLERFEFPRQPDQFDPYSEFCIIEKDGLRFGVRVTLLPGKAHAPR